MRVLLLLVALLIGACAAVPEISQVTPLVVAHRGDSALAPENTLAAYRLALAKGVEAAECDVVVSRDRVPFLLHDQTLDRTTNAKGPADRLSWAELSKLDAGGWKSDEWTGERLPTLDQFLALMQGRALAVVEIKVEGIEKEVVESFDRTGTKPEDVMLFSFRESVMSYFAEHGRTWPRTWLVSGKLARADRRDALFQRIQGWGLKGLGFDRRSLDRALVERAHARGLEVFVWTVNDEAEARRLAGLGVDAIISDRPAEIRQALK